MQIVETTNEGLKRGYTVKIAAQDIASRIEGEARKMAPQARLPGFPPGRCPPTCSRRCTARSFTRKR